MRRPLRNALTLALALTLGAPVARAADAPVDEVVNLALVLLPEAAAPRGEDVERAFAAFAVKGQKLRFRPGKARKTTAADPLEFELGGVGTAFVTAFVALMPVAVPNHEADDAVRYSVSAMGGRWKLGAHRAHLVVTARGGTRTPETLSAFTSFVAAVAQSSSALGVTCGSAGATHDAKFYEDIAREKDTASRLVLWSGVSIAQEPDGRLGLLSLGMKQLDLPDLLLVLPASKSDDALGTLFDLLAFMVRSGRPSTEIDTWARTARGRYVPSPVDPKVKVWRVDVK